jgi:hypothetical protein
MEWQEDADSCILRSFGLVKEDEMGRACSTKGERRMRIGYWWDSQKERCY